MKKQPRIAIVGAGPAGLTLGVLLHKRSVPFTIYELRQRPTEEELSKPSGMLDLHQESGLAAIRACELFDEFKPLTAECADTMIVVNQDDTVVYTDNGGLEYRPEISRHALIKLLLKEIPDDLIRWGMKLKSAAQISAASEIILEFEESGLLTYDFVVGADGAWSKIRPLLTTEIPHSSGLHYVSLTIPNITSRFPALASFIGPGTMFALGTRNGIATHRSSQDSARLDLCVNEKNYEVDGPAGVSIKDLRETFLSDERVYGLWGPTLKELITVGFNDEESVTPEVNVKPLAMLPIGHRWDTKAGATVIGDAAHLMTPFAGEGVNLAMRDALDLADVISKTYKSTIEGNTPFSGAILPRLKLFEDEMLDRSMEMAEESWRNCCLLFGDNGAQAMADLFKSFFSWKGMYDMVYKKAHRNYRYMMRRGSALVTAWVGLE
jgi:2-polyprenyl-6-methoxyphenol hydroxylase-like FAD-dependent oxidoreductase